MTGQGEGDETPPVLLTTPEPDPDEPQAMPMAMVSGRLSISDRDCLTIDDRLLGVPHGSTASMDPPGISVPGSDFVPDGVEIFGAGGYYAIDDFDEQERCTRFATEATAGVVLVGDLRATPPTGVRSRRRANRPHLP